MRKIDDEADIVGVGETTTHGPLVLAEARANGSTCQTRQAAAGAHEDQLSVDELGLAMLRNPIKVFNRRASGRGHLFTHRSFYLRATRLERASDKVGPREEPARGQRLECEGYTFARASKV